MDKYRAIRRIISVGVLTALLWLPALGVVQAHALLVRSTPGAGAELTAAPPTIEMWFSEPLEAQFSNAHLMDAQGNVIGSGTSTIDPADPMHMTLMLEGLSPGIYTVVWRTLSSADGHEWLGSFPITILNADGTRPTTTAAPVATPVEELGRGELPTPLQTFSRWLALLGAMIVLGVIAVQAITVQPRSADPETANAEALPDPNSTFMAVVRRCVQISLFVGLGAVLIGGTIQLLWQAQSLGGLAMIPRLLLQTRTGNLLLVRQGLALILLLFVRLVARRPLSAAVDKPLGAVQWLLLPLSLVMISTFSIVSHAAAVAGSGWAIVGDLIHLVAAAVWLGGLGLLALLLWQLRQLPSARDATALRQTVRRFSAVATVAVFLLICTGLFSTLVQIESVALLWQTTYGLVLLAKVVLVGVALGIALLNHRLVHRRSTPAWTLPTYRAFLRQVWAESLIALALMLVVAVLVQTKVPPRATVAMGGADNIFNAILGTDEAPTGAAHQHDAAATPAHTAEHTVAAMPELMVHLQIAPNRVGNNRYIVHLYQADGSAIGEVQLVRLLFEHQTAELGQATLDLSPQGPTDFFGGEGAYQNRAGPWTVSAYVRRRGMDDLLVKTTVDVPAPGADVAVVRNVWQNPITTLPAGVVVGGALATLGLLPLVWLWSRR